MLTENEARTLNDKFELSNTQTVLEWAWERFGEKAAIGTSFQGAGLVMLHLARLNRLNFPVFTLDTGLLFPETIALKKRLELFFEIAIESLSPDLTVEQQALAHGPELWARDPDLCCSVRKVVPLQSKLSELDCWITGLRRQQSESRGNVQIVEVYAFDPSSGRDIVKLNPMVRWSKDEVWNYIKEHHIPYNPLHDQGYRSIGCLPCTRKSDAGDSERAGRWTGFNKTECGIHTFMAKKG